MNGLCIPSPRRRGPLQRAWLTPTNALGHRTARALGCGQGLRVGGGATPAWLYLLPEGRLQGLGAIALGHVILAERDFVSGHRGTWVLAHELSHTRQHDWLGPLYLPIHGICQLLSVLLALVRPVAGFPPQHGYNILERYFLCVPFDAIATDAQPGNGVGIADRVLDAFGLSSSRALELRVGQ